MSTTSNPSNTAQSLASALRKIGHSSIYSRDCPRALPRFLQIGAFVLGVEWGWSKYWYYSNKEATLLAEERKKNIEEIKKLKAEIAQLKGTPVDHGHGHGHH